MKLTPKIVGPALVVLALSGAGIGTAVASSHAPARHGVVQSEPTTPDTDAVQQGDQTSPDPAGAVAPHAASHVRAASHMKATTSGEETDSESSGSSDGPGGHADPSGDVQHEFTGVE
jgi:hypothetical protein